MRGSSFIYRTCIRRRGTVLMPNFSFLNNCSNTSISQVKRFILLFKWRRGRIKKSVILPLALLILMSFFTETDAAVRTWTGAVNNNAHIAGNWSGGVVPASGDDVVFDGSASVDCKWNINPVLSSLSISPGYSGMVTVKAGLTMTGDISIEAGTLDAQLRTITVGGDWIYFSGTDTPLGDIDGDNDVDENDISAISLMIFDPATITYCSDMNFDGGTDILDVISALRVSNGIDGTRDCTGGVFQPGTGTVVFNGTDQTVFGDTVFYNLEKIASCSGDTLYFEAGSTQTILGRLTLEGASGCLLALESDIPDTQWNIDPQGTRNISFSSIKDRHCCD
jgi:hypothetical protein